MNNLVTIVRYLVISLFFSQALAGSAYAKSSLASGFGRMHLQSAERKWSVNRVIFSDGSKVERFELRAGDCSGTDCRRDRERVEFTQSKGVAQGKDIWVGWSVFFPKDFPRQGRRMTTKIGQWHLPKWQGQGQGPTVLFEMSDECLRLTVKDPKVADNNPMRPAANLFSKCIALRSAMLGRWTRFMVNVKWSVESKGYFKVFVNGELKWKYQGRTTNIPARPYFRYGLYRSFVSRCNGPCPTQIVFYRNVRQGSNRNQVE